MDGGESDHERGSDAEGIELQRCREIQKQNYYLSLDHRSFYFRQSDKKEITTKVLIDTIKELAAKQAAEASSHSLDEPREKGRFDEGEPPFRFAFANRVVHKQVLRLLLVAGKRQFTRTEMVRSARLLLSRNASAHCSSISLFPFSDSHPTSSPPQRL